MNILEKLEQVKGKKIITFEVDDTIIKEITELAIISLVQNENMLSALEMDEIKPNMKKNDIKIKLNFTTMLNKFDMAYRKAIKQYYPVSQFKKDLNVEQIEQIERYGTIEQYYDLVFTFDENYKLFIGEKFNEVTKVGDKKQGK